MFQSIVGWVRGGNGDAQSPSPLVPSAAPGGDAIALEGHLGELEVTAPLPIESGWAVVITGEEGAPPSTVDLNLETASGDDMPPLFPDTIDTGIRKSFALLEAEPVFSVSPDSPSTPEPAPMTMAELAAATVVVDAEMMAGDSLAFSCEYHREENHMAYSLSRYALLELFPVVVRRTRTHPNRPVPGR